MDSGLIGSFAMWAAAALCAVSVVTGSRRLLAGAAGVAAAATLTLAGALLFHDFSLAYVADTTSFGTPWPYRLSALWGGMDGSMLFYAAMTLAVGVAGVRSRPAVRTVAAVGLGLLVVTWVFANPFVALPIPAVDGEGLLAILQHPAMVYHPPILYLGLTSLIVPMALTVGQVLVPGSRDEWLRATRRWLYLSWTLLTIGMAAGANWAYVELGWGGFWAWDPVENTALMPWLATTVFLHTSLIEQSSGRLRRLNVTLATLPFALSVLGIYLTRSGATGSIHSFAEDPVVGRVLLVAALFAAIGVAFLTRMSPRGDDWGRVRLDREGWLVVNAALLLPALVFVVAGSAYPAYVSVFRGRDVVVDSRFFVVTILPIAVVVAAGVWAGLRRRGWSAQVIGSAMIAGVVVLVSGPRVGVLLLAPALASVLALVRVLAASRLRARLVPVVAHLGIAVFLFGVAGSSMGGEFHGTMAPGDTVEVAGHEIELRTVTTGDDGRYLFVRAEVAVNGSALAPEIRAYESQATPVSEPALRTGPLDDVLVAISLLFPDGETVEVSVFVRPLVWWVWVGAGLIGLAGSMALFGRGVAGARLRPAARAEQRSGDRSSETAVR